MGRHLSACRLLQTLKLALNSKRLSEGGKYILILSRAYADYKTVFQAGDDKKKPAWLARKSCNYLTNAMKVNIDLGSLFHDFLDLPPP